MRDRLPWIFLLLLILLGMASAVAFVVVAQKNAPEQIKVATPAREVENRNDD